MTSAPDRHSARGLVRNILSNWAVLALSIVYTLFITPIVVRALEQERYGVWSFLNGLTAYSGLLYLGLGAAVIKFTAVHRANKDQAALKRLASVTLSIYSVLGVTCLVALIAVSSRMTDVFADPLSTEAARATVRACQLLGGHLFFVFVGSAFSGILAGHDRFDLVNLVQLVGIFARIIAVPLLVQPEGSPMVMLAAITVATAAFQAVILAFILLATVRDLSFKLTVPRLSELKVLYGFGLSSFVVLFASKLISNTDTTVIGIMLGAPAVMLYALPLQLVESCRIAVNGFAGVLLPRLTALVESGDIARLRNIYLRSIRVSSSLTGWLVAGMVVLGPDFLNRWIGPEIGTPTQWVIVFLAGAMFVQVISSQVPLAFYQSLHLVAFPAVVLIIEAFINLGLSVWLAPQLGINGVALATVVPAFLISGALLPIYLGRHIDVPLDTLVRAGVLPGVLMLATTGVTLWVSGLAIESASYTGIVGRGLASVPAAVLAVWWGFPRSELRAIAATLGSTFRRSPSR